MRESNGLGAPEREVQFLTVEDVILIHSRVIDRITPGEPKDILDYGRLEAAVMTPQQTFGGEYLYPSVCEMAAAYLYGLAMGHAFQQGNKRVAFLSCYTFLQVNNTDLTMTNEEAISMTLRVVTHDLDRDGLAGLLEKHSQPW